MKKDLEGSRFGSLTFVITAESRAHRVKEGKMRETILLVHFTDQEKRKKLTRALLPLGLRMKEVGREDYGKAVGVLAGQKGISQEETEQEEGFSGPEPGAEGPIEQELSGELLIMAGLSGPRIDQVLRAIRKAGLSLPYKAVLTASNQSWNVWKLFQEIKEEHQRMSG